MKLEINIAKKHLYYLVGLLVFVFITAIAIAQSSAPNPGHAAAEIGEGTIANTLTVSAGNVGIGVTDPLVKLSLPNQAYIAWKASGNSGAEITSFRSNSDKFEFTTNGLIRAVIDSTGNVGIGTTSPGSKLHIEGTHARLQVKDPEGEIAYMEALSANDNVRIGSASNHPVAFSANNNEYMYLTTSGNVGIGTASPGTKLDVDGTGRFKQGIFKSESEIAHVTLGYNDGTRDYGVFQWQAAGVAPVNYFQNSVGIGTTGPGRNLDTRYNVAKTDTNDRQVAFFGSNEAIASNPLGLIIGFTGGASSGVRYTYIQSTESDSTNNNLVLQKFGGNVGIGTTSPTEKLHVAGAVKATQFNTGDIIFNKNGDALWRMFEDEDGLYVENLKTGKVYKIDLQEVK